LKSLGYLVAVSKYLVGRLRKIKFKEGGKYNLIDGISKLSGILAIREFLELLRCNAALDISRILKGIDYYRGIEYPTTMALLDNRDHTDYKIETKLLDVGSFDAPLPICFAARGYKVYALDVNKRVLKLENTAKNLGIYNLKSVIADATKLPFGYNSFDIVTAISTIEHVLPLEDGDTKAMKEIGKVLKPGGMAVITVPYKNSFSEEWRHHPAHGKYLMRSYNEDSIHSRLIKPSGLFISKIFYFCDDIGFCKIWYKLLVYMLSPLSYLFARVFLKLKVKPINAKGIMIVLEKKENYHNHNTQVKNPSVKNLGK